MRIAKRYLVSGRVQGVGFRYFAQHSARRVGLDGWVRNTPDGGVEVEAAGEPDALDRFEGELRSGPPGARISAVEVTVLPDAPTDRGFRIQ